jgi:hypothetical protein
VIIPTGVHACDNSIETNSRSALEKEESPWSRQEGEATGGLPTSHKIAMSPASAIVKMVILGQRPRSRLILIALNQPISHRERKLVRVAR